MSAATGDSAPCVPARAPRDRTGLSLRYACAGGAHVAAPWPCDVGGWLLGRCDGEPGAVDSMSQLASLCTRCRVTHCHIHRH